MFDERKEDKESKVQDESHLIIHGWMLNRLDIKGLDLLIYAIIYGFSKDGEGCFYGTLEYLAQWTKSTTRGVKKSLLSLIDKNLIVKEKVKYNKYTYKAIVPQYGEHSSSQMGNTVPHDGEHSSSQMGNTVPHDGELSSPNNIDIKKINNIVDKKTTSRKSQKDKNNFKNYPQRQNEIDYIELEQKMCGG